MKFTRSWLADHLDCEATTQEVATRLTALGLEVEAIVDRAAILSDFTVARVTKVKPHPNADRLKVCCVDTGHDVVQVVCGASNVRTGMKGVFAPVGSHVPGTHLDLRKTKIRGIESNGMLLSELELGISDEHEGIIELPKTSKVGETFIKSSGLDDAVMEIAITPNRGDCLGVRGIARDLAAAGVGRLKPHSEIDGKKFEGTFRSPIKWLRKFSKDSQQACPMVVGRSFRNVKNKQSPDWLKNWLNAIGLRPISALVDITNYITFDLGRPLHVYDIDKLSGNLTMRLAKPSETIRALDGKDYALDDHMIVIADEGAVNKDRIQGIGGIMGGEASSCTEETQNVFLEVALFDPVRVAATGRKLGLESDARYRFERNVDPQSALWGVEVATRLITEICGGEASTINIAGEIPVRGTKITLNPKRIATLGGLDLPVDRIQEILDALGFTTDRINGVINAEPPSWRPDIENESCLVEEVLRIQGFDTIPVVSLNPERFLSTVTVSPEQRRESLARKILAGRGMMEAVTWSFVSSKEAKNFGGVSPSLELSNPISEGLDVMRPSILPNLLNAAVRNINRGFHDVALFEVGAVWRDDTPTGQDLVATGIRVGNSGTRHWAQNLRNVDAYDVKADVEAVVALSKISLNNFQVSNKAPDWYQRGRAGTFKLGSRHIAWFGELNPRILEDFNLSESVVAFEVVISNFPPPKSRSLTSRSALSISPYQRVTRDFAFIVQNDLPASKLLQAVSAADRELIVDIGVFDIYRGEHINEGEKSVAISVTLQPRERTLTDAEIGVVEEKIISLVLQKVGGVLRN